VRDKVAPKKEIDALLAELCIRHDLTMLSTDNDFKRIAAHSRLKVWPA